MSKKALGIGYILMAIPIIDIIGLIITPIGWFLLGKREGKGLWKATGITGIISFILVLVALAITGIGAAFEMFTGAVAPTEIFRGANAVLIAAAILLLIFAILSIASLWSAGKHYDSGLLKAASILWIVTIVLAIISIPLAIVLLFFGLGLWILLAILAFIANILAGVGFLKIA